MAEELNSFQKIYKELERPIQLVSYEAGLYGHGGSVPEDLQELFDLLYKAQRKAADLGWPEE
jgi:hypothetical protein